MKIRELKEFIKDLPDDMLVVMSKDAEGNSYSPLAAVDGENNVYIADSTWSGEISLKELTPELEKSGWSEEDVADEGQGEDCVVLWPTN